MYELAIDDQLARYDSLTVPLVADDYLQMPEPKPVRDIYAEIASVAKLSNVSTQERDSHIFRTFKLRGTYTGGDSEGEMQDWQTMNSVADDLLLSLTDLPWDGYKILTAHFTNYRVDGEGRFAYDLVFHRKKCHSVKTAVMTVTSSRILTESRTIIGSRLFIWKPQADS
ncbi:hypothetical protein ACFVQB_19650 [Paenibacillus sp. NPDC057886]|uniref:hypothetical protein n=1 Tax=Paenibacillus sp. NPDC057886 TaxID=3346270 RepID=UPI0036D08FF5